MVHEAASSFRRTRRKKRIHGMFQLTAKHVPDQNLTETHGSRDPLDSKQ